MSIDVPALGLSDGSEALDLVALGEGLIEFNQTQPGRPEYLQGFGGDTANVLVAAARQGARVAYVTAVGDDSLGQMLTDLWRAEGVDPSGVQVRPQSSTGVYFVHHDDSGHRFSYLRRHSAASQMQPNELPRELLRRARCLHVSGISQAISPSAAACVDEAVAQVHAQGGRISFDPNLRLNLWPAEQALVALQRVLPFVSDFLPGTGELATLTGLDDPAQQIAWAHAQGAQRVLLKMGEQGALVSDGRQQRHLRPPRVTAVDATGAGDCLDGVYLAASLHGLDLWAAAERAVWAAALSTTGFGAIAPLPTRAALDAFMRHAEPT